MQRFFFALAMMIVLAPVVARACEPDSLRGDPARGGAQESQSGDLGRVSGKVTDTECEEWVGGASIRLIGTDTRTTSDACGNFAINGVTPGTWDIRVTKPGFAGYDTTVVVDGGAVTKCDVVLGALVPPPRAPALPSTSTERPRCEVHDAEMIVVVVPIDFDVGSTSDREYRAVTADFPNADPFEDTEDAILADQRARWTYRCEECVLARNLWLNGGWWPFVFSVVPEGWQTYQAGEVEFVAPPGLDERIQGGRCSASGTLTGEGIKITAIHHPSTYARVPENTSLHGEALIADTIAHIAVRHDRDGMASLIATFRAMPTSRSVFAIYVSVPEGELDVAAAIVGSVHLVHE